MSILSTKAENTWLLTVAVNPRNTSQNCSNCGHKVPKKLSDRWHSCPNCKYEADRDVNAAKNILNLAVGHPVSSKAD
ncbi:transposase [Okeania sp. SIO2C2]|uniref:transposase n=1 Tax=Okeania sp. SIO2C2 TaxID=2607787 RepID=UPI00338ED437